MNPFRQLLDKVQSHQPLNRSESARIGRIGLEKLPLYAEAYDALSQVYPTRTARREARDLWAQKLDITSRAVNLIIKPDFQRPERIKEIHKHYLETAERQLALFQAALKVISGQIDPEKAAEGGDFSTRTVYRKVQTLLEGSTMALADLQSMPLDLRKGLASDISAKHLPKLKETLEKRRANALREKETRKRRETKDT